MLRRALASILLLALLLAPAAAASCQARCDQATPSCHSVMPPMPGMTETPSPHLATPCTTNHPCATAEARLNTLPTLLPTHRLLTQTTAPPRPIPFSPAVTQTALLHRRPPPLPIAADPLSTTLRL